MSRKGWIKLYRKTFENPICCKDPEYFFVWCWILTHAAYEEKRTLYNGQDTTVNKGEIVTTNKFISSELKISESKVNRILKSLESERQIERRPSRRNTLISVLNWEKYQSEELQNEIQVKDERNESERQVKDNRNASEKPTLYKEKKNLKKKEVKKGGSSEFRNYDSEHVEERISESHQRKDVVISLILNDESDFLIYRNEIDEWQSLYPAVDIMQELRKMKGWLDSNPEKRKTKRGIKRFINNWLERNQDLGGTQKLVENRRLSISEEEKTKDWVNKWEEA